MTLTRMIVHLQMLPTTRGVSDETSLLDVGIGLVGQDAFSAGAVPDPVVQGDRPISDWVWRDRFLIEDRFDDNDTYHVFTDVRVDLKGQRKIGEGELVLIMDNNASSGNGFTISVFGLIRCLFKLP